MLKLALTTKWIAALVLCLLMAAGFAILAQWQINRSFVPNSSNTNWTKVDYVQLNTIAEPNTAFAFNEVTEVGKEKILTQTLTRIKYLPTETFIVDRRFQSNGTAGYWLVVKAKTEDAVLFVAVGFAEDLDKARAAASEINAMPETDVLQPVSGRYLPSESPLERADGESFHSLSVPELFNLSEATGESVYTGFLAITKNNSFTKLPGIQPLTIGLAQSDSQLNLLSAFYAIEWTVFAGFAVFMWWRLLADSYKKQQAELLEAEL